MTGDSERRIGLLRATTVGIGAIMGGGVLVLAGVAFAEAGPGVLAAFAANWVVARTMAALSPFLPGGVSGVVAVMGLTFITVQGFEVVAAMAGEIEAPARTIPRAMVLALGISMLIYLPLLFVVATVGTAPGQTITALATAQPETMVAVAARRFLGVPGYWLVVVAAVLASLSALQATMLAAARVARFMALDHTLPRVLGEQHARHGTPVMAIYASTLTLVAILFMVPNLAAAGAAAGLIFLVSFTLGHVTTYLARVRGGGAPDAYRTPLFPLVPVIGGVACAFLAVFQAVVAPVAARQHRAHGAARGHVPARAAARRWHGWRGRSRGPYRQERRPRRQSREYPRLRASRPSRRCRQPRRCPQRRAGRGARAGAPPGRAHLPGAHNVRRGAGRRRGRDRGPGRERVRPAGARPAQRAHGVSHGPAARGVRRAGHGHPRRAPCATILLSGRRSSFIGI